MIIASATNGLDISKISVVDNMAISNTESEGSITEIYLHANMPVVGNHTLIFLDYGRTCGFSAYWPGYEPMNFNIVDAYVQYD